MKLEIDTELKVIEFNERISLKELIEQLDSIFVDERWKEYSIQPKNLSEPMITHWEYPNYRYYPHWTYQPNLITYTECVIPFNK